VLDFHSTWVKNTLKYIISDVRICICSVQLSDSVTIKKLIFHETVLEKKTSIVSLFITLDVQNFEEVFLIFVSLTNYFPAPTLYRPGCFVCYISGAVVLCCYFVVIRIVLDLLRV